VLALTPELALGSLIMCLAFLIIIMIYQLHTLSKVKSMMEEIISEATKIEMSASQGKDTLYTMSRFMSEMRKK